MLPPPFVGEPLALDLVNTRMRAPGGVEVDLLATPEKARTWLAAEQHRLDPPRGEVQLGALRTLRGHVEQAVEQARCGQAPPEPALRALTAAMRRAPAHREVGWDGTAVTATVHRTGDATADLLAVLAEAATDLLTDPAVDRVRSCEGPGCRLLFLATNPRRRWCSPALCGNRVRVARHHRRHRAPEPG